VIALVVLALGAPRASADSDATTAIAFAVGTAAVLGISCWTAHFAEKDRNVRLASEGKAPTFERPGWLVGLTGRYAWGNYRDEEQEDMQVALWPFVISMTEGNSGGVSGWAGYRCHRRFSTEVEVEWMNGFEGDIDELVQGTVAEYSLSPIVVTSNAKGYLLTGRYQPYVLAGAGAMTVESIVRDFRGPGGTRSDRLTMFTMRFGAGVDVYATKNIVVNVDLDYVLPVAGVKNLQYLTFGGGLQYRF